MPRNHAFEERNTHYCEQAVALAIIFLLLNVWMLNVQIPVQERVLREATNYEDASQKVQKAS